MNLMGDYAAANHAVIHRARRAAPGRGGAGRRREPPQLRLEGSARRPRVIVHRKGATPAGAGRAGRHPRLDGHARLRRARPRRRARASPRRRHGAGRVMSRTAAKERFTLEAGAARCSSRPACALLSAGIDENPLVYKDINEVMAAQTDLVDVVARFTRASCAWRTRASGRRTEPFTGAGPTARRGRRTPLARRRSVGPWNHRQRPPHPCAAPESPTSPHARGVLPFWALVGLGVAALVIPVISAVGAWLVRPSVEPERRPPGPSAGCPTCRPSLS